MQPLCSKSLKSSSPLFSSMTSTFISTRAVLYVTTFLFIILLYFPQPLTSSPDVPFIHEGTHIHRSLVLEGNKRTSPVKASSRHSLSPAPQTSQTASLFLSQRSKLIVSVNRNNNEMPKPYYNYIFHSDTAVSVCPMLSCKVRCFSIGSSYSTTEQK